MFRLIDIDGFRVVQMIQDKAWFAANGLTARYWIIWAALFEQLEKCFPAVLRLLKRVSHFLRVPSDQALPGSLNPLISSNQSTRVSHKNLWKYLLLIFLAMGHGTYAADQKPRFELLHLWGSDGETRALAAYSQAVKARGVDWTEHIVFFNYLGVRAMFAKRLALSAPPSGLFWVGGNSAEQMIEAGLFREIPVTIGDVDFSRALLPEVYDVVRYKDSIAMLPVGSHIQNRIFYNKEILEEVGATIPKSWDEFLELAPKVTQAGYHSIIVTDQRWQNRYFFLSILAEKLSADEMRRFLSGTDPVETYHDALFSSMKILLELRKYSNPDIGDLTWDAAIGKVYHKNGFAYILGDFTGALIPRDDGSVICTNPPGNDYLMWAIDGIALTQTDDPDVIAGQNILIEVIGSPEYHRKYLAAKGGISAYVNGDKGDLDSCAQASKQTWEETREKIFVTSEEWTQTLDTFATITSTIWRKPEIMAKTATAKMIQALQAARRVSSGGKH